MTYKKNADMSRRILRRYLAILRGMGEYLYWQAPQTPAMNAMAAFIFAKSYLRYRGVDFSRLQNFVVRHGSAECVYRWAREIPGANVKKCQSRMMAVGTPGEMRKFANNVPGAHLPSIEALAIIKEVLAM